MRYLIIIAYNMPVKCVKKQVASIFSLFDTVGCKTLFEVY